MGGFLIELLCGKRAAELPRVVWVRYHCLAPYPRPHTRTRETAPMKIHEYQAKEILRKYHVPVPGGEMATTLEEADVAAKQLFTSGNKVVVVKAQIHAGGRGKGGGVKLAKSLEEANAASKAILGMQLVTHQTGPAGQKVRRLLIEEGSAIERELYLGLVLDRASAKVVFMASQSGGMEIEEVAHATPELIYKEYIDPAVGFQPYQARKAGVQAGADDGADSAGGGIYDWLI